MSAFGGLIFTNKGRNLQAKAQAGAQLNFTRIAVGDGDLGGSSIADLNALVHQVKTISITKLSILTGGKAVVGGSFSNQDLITGFYWKELGVFATDPDLGEILYCYGNSGANAEYIPAGGGPDVVEKSIDVVTIVGNAANVTATIEQSLIYYTQDDVLTVDQAQAPVSPGNGKISQLFNWLANRIKAITGKANWWDAPSKSLEDFYMHESAADPHPQYALDTVLASHQADYSLQVPYGGITTNVGNAYSIATPAITALTEGMAISVKINANSTGTATLNWNGKGAKGIKKVNGTDASVKANGIYTLRYDGANFILQGEGASGNAIASDLLSGKTASTDAGDITGTMPNKVGSATVITPSTADQAVPQGYYGGAVGDGKVLGDADLIAGNIKSGVNIFGVNGNLQPRQYATGTVTSTAGGGITITGLSFRPKIVLVWLTTTDTSANRLDGHAYFDDPISLNGGATCYGIQSYYENSTLGGLYTPTTTAITASGMYTGTGRKANSSYTYRAWA